MTVEQKIVNEIKLLTLTERWQTSDLDDSGNLVVEMDGLSYLVEVKAFPMGYNVD